MTEQQIPQAKLDKTLAKVRALIAKAESTDSPAEAEALRERADALMFAHAIDEVMLEASRPEEQRTKPAHIRIKLADKSHLTEQITYLAQYLANHYRVRLVFMGLYTKHWGDITVTAVGYESDLRFFETMFTALHLDLAGKLTPKADPAETFDANVYRMRDAGMSWGAIAHEMNKTRANYLKANAANTAAQSLVADWKEIPIREDAQYPIPAGAYRRECKRRGEAPRRTRTPVGYQRNFAEGYVNRIGLRLAEMRRKRDNEGSGTALVLRSDSVEDMVNELFPKMSKSKAPAKLKTDWQARVAGDEAGKTADLGGHKVKADDRREIEGR
jgi:uncharacterized protein DUF2786